MQQTSYYLLDTILIVGIESVSNIVLVLEVFQPSLQTRWSYVREKVFSVKSSWSDGELLQQSITNPTSYILNKTVLIAKVKDLPLLGSYQPSPPCSAQWLAYGSNMPFSDTWKQMLMVSTEGQANTLNYSSMNHSNLKCIFPFIDNFVCQ